ncbi:MAG TPA: 4-alpha-glucanotransferase [Polyangia bacterium]|jgi:4-alpha-glucanotransferase|nr:4-alpha-glucanotransferase [Polyangia bacterium]
MRLPKLTDRSSGVLLHPTSLPGEDLGATAREMVDFLAAAGQSWWQMLPVGPTGYGNSPYSAQSAFAGNPGLISLERLGADGILGADARRHDGGDHLANAFVAFSRSGGADHPDFRRFSEEAREWLEDFALYRAIKDVQGGVQWTRWPAPLRDRDAGALARFRQESQREIDFHRFAQWRFFGDWKALREYAQARGIGLIGDLPIFLAHDSADVWLNRGQFYLDDAGEPTLVAGVPPDYFSATGQRWGNPLYRWAEMRASGFAWWIARFRATLAMFDAVRLDHFIGYTRYWAIPAREPTAVKGRWRPGPGARFFRSVAAALGELPLIAEDLGVVTPAVESLRARFGFPGLKLLQFAFGTDPQAPSFLPHNYPRAAVAYTGTHDNDTTVGWFRDLGSGARGAGQAALERRTALRYLGDDDDLDDDGREIHWRMIRAIMGSVADVAIVPAQDLLGLGSEARMNHPGTATGNWSFRLAPGALTPAIANRLRDLTEIYGRRRPEA